MPVRSAPIQRLSDCGGRMKGFFCRGNFLKKVSPAPLQKLSERWIEALRGCLLTPGVGAAVCVLGPPPKTHSRESYFSVGSCEKTFATVFPCYVNKAYMREVFPTPLSRAFPKVYQGVKGTSFDSRYGYCRMRFGATTQNALPKKLLLRGMMRKPFTNGFLVTLMKPI